MNLWHNDLCYYHLAFHCKNLWYSRLFITILMPGPFPPSQMAYSVTIITHYQTTNFRLFQTERVCRQQFQIRRKWQKVIKWVENTVGKGEIARYAQFLLFPQCFQKACFQGASKGVIVWEWVKVMYHVLSTQPRPGGSVVIASSRPG